MASVHLSISKHSVISPLFRRRSFLSASAPPSSLHFCFPLLLKPFLPLHLSTPTSPFISYSFYLFSPLQYPSSFPFSLHLSPLHPLLPPPAPRRLLCSQWNSPFSNKTKAAQSITHWLIKQDQNAAALTSTQHHQDTGSHWSGEQQDLRKGWRE